MLKFGIFEACVLVDGAELPEYNATTDEESKTVTCWVPSEQGKAFGVMFRNATSYPTSLGGCLTTDGNQIASKILHGGICKDITISWAPTSPTSHRELLFSSIELTDDDAFLGTTNVKDLGNISLNISEVRLLGKNNTCPTLKVADGKVHERIKKAMGHRVGLGPENIMEPRVVYKTETIRRLVTFIFKYRPIGVLRADGIAPAEPSSSQEHQGKRKVSEDADEDEDDGGDDSRDGDAVARVEERLQALVAEIGEIHKLLKTTTKKKPNKRVKTESSPTIVPGEVIDLT